MHFIEEMEWQIGTLLTMGDYTKINVSDGENISPTSSEITLGNCPPQLLKWPLFMFSLLLQSQSGEARRDKYYCQEKEGET
jgi:hypothetical protein